MSIQWSLVLFTALTGLAGWVFACVLVSELTGKAQHARFSAMLVGFVAMALGGFASVLHLAHPENMLGAFGHPTSGIFIEAALLGISALCAAVYLILAKKGSSDIAWKSFLVVCAVSGVALSFMAGSSYMMSSCPGWNTPLLPIGYLGTALSMGVTAYLVIVCLKGEGEDSSFFSKVALAGALVGATSAALYAFGASQVLEAAGLPIVLSLAANVVAAVFCVVAMKSRNAALVAAVLACVCALVGGIAYRCAMWLSMVPINDFFNML